MCKFIGKILNRFMPVINKPTTIVEKIHTKEGEVEVTINLNLHISVDGNNVSVTTTKLPSTEIESIEKKKVLVPEEMFDIQVPTVNFGQKM